MRAASSAERLVDVPAGIRAAMVALGWIPAAHALLALAPLAVAYTRADAAIALWSPAVLYLLPPLAVRLQARVWPLPRGRVDLASGAFLRWWASAQWQVVFARLPWLDELLRLLPGVYSAWLRLWGARIGSLVYWSPGVAVLDRPLVRVGDRTVFGAGVRINPHVVAPGPDGRGALYVAPIAIGADVLVGGYSTLLPGCEIADGEVTAPFRSIHAFTHVERGRRRRLPDAPFDHDADADVR
jgi:hypothetical protein